MKSVVVIFAVVVVVEALVEYGSMIARMVETKEYKTAVKQLCAIAVCTFFCFQCHADIFAYCGLEFGIPWLGVALTGVFGSRGSNYISDLVKRLQSATGAAARVFDDYTPAGAQPTGESEGAAG